MVFVFVGFTAADINIIELMKIDLTTRGLVKSNEAAFIMDSIKLVRIRAIAVGQIIIEISKFSVGVNLSDAYFTYWSIHNYLGRMSCTPRCFKTRL